VIVIVVPVAVDIYFCCM